MTLETFYTFLTNNNLPIFLVIIAAPFLAWLLCELIPGEREEPLILGINLWFALLSLALWVGYLAFALNARGVDKVAKEANLLLLLAPPYYIIASFLLSRQRISLSRLPAFRTLQGVIMLLVVFLVFAWLGQRIHLVLFSYIPFTSFLFILAGLLLFAYLGYRRVFRNRPKHRRPF